MESPELPYDIDDIKCQNTKLSCENNELKKMMNLMQENLELRFALKDHETRVRSCTPPPALTSPTPPRDKCRDNDRWMYHCAQDFSSSCKYQGKGPHMGGHTGNWLRHCDESGKGGKASSSPYREKFEGHKKKTCYDRNVERIMSNYK